MESGFRIPPRPDLTRKGTRREQDGKRQEGQMVLLRSIVLATATILLTADMAAADSIQLTTGALDWHSGSGAVAISMGGDQFTFAGVGPIGGGIFGPWNQCSVPDCVAGSAVDLTSYWSGLDLPGTATYQGQTFTAVGSANATSSMEAQWTGTATIPADFAGGDVTAPFAFSGNFYYGIDPNLPPSPLHLFGTGTATLSFSPFAFFPGSFHLDTVSYAFGAEAPAPTPEPASVLLLGTGLAALAARRHRQRAHA
jgi:hypothetical protein